MPRTLAEAHHAPDGRHATPEPRHGMKTRRRTSILRKFDLTGHTRLLRVRTGHRAPARGLELTAADPVHCRVLRWLPILPLRGRAMATGSCNCERIAWSIDFDPADVYVCHCSICRRATGSNGIAVVLVANESLRWLRGKELITTWKKPNADWQTWFCRQCGSPVPGSNDDTRMFVPAGAITDGGNHLKVAHHIFVDSKAVWDEIGDAGKQHAGAFEG